MSKYLDYNGLQHYTECFKPGLAELINSGAKNVISPTGTTETSNQVTFTYNTNGTISANGTATGGDAVSSVLTISASEAQSFNGLVLSGCPTGGYEIRLQLSASPNTVYATDTGSGVVISDVPAQKCEIVLFVAENKSIDATFSPMVCTEAAWKISHTYAPYCMTNAEQDEQINENKTNISLLSEQVGYAITELEGAL